jgi:hypothetical protein
MAMELHSGHWVRGVSSGLVYWWAPLLGQLLEFWVHEAVAILAADLCDLIVELEGLAEE